jgi:hypothetical protein
MCCCFGFLFLKRAIEFNDAMRSSPLDDLSCGDSIKFTQLFIKMDTRNTIEFIAFFNDRLFIITVFLCYRNFFFFFNFSPLLFIRHLTLDFLRIKKVSRDCLVFLCNNYNNNYIIIYK